MPASTKKLEKEYAGGATIRELAEKYGISYGKIHKLLTANGATLRKRGPRPK